MEAPPASAIVVVAPAGYGKSALLTEWANVDPRPFIWLRLVPADDDPVRLSETLAGALRSVGMKVGPLATAEAVVEALPRAIRAWEGPFVIVLDDCDKLRRRATLRVLADLIDSLGAQGQIALAGRHEPDLPIPRLRAERRLLELGAADLVLSHSELAAMAAANGLELDEAQRDLLTRRTEGWPAAVYLAALAARESADPRQSLADFGGADRHVTDYLRAEVLAPLPRRLSEFVRRASILARLSAPVCDYVLDRHDSGKALAELSRTSLLVVPLDRTGSEYRYHTLLSEALRAELRREDPEEEAKLHARASAWYDAHGDSELAIEHALRAGDPEHAGALLWRETPALIGYGHAQTVIDHLGRFTEQELASYAPLSMCAAFAQLVLGDRAGTEQWVATALNRSAKTRNGSVTAAAYALRALVSARDLDEMLADASRAYQAAGADGPARALACLATGVALQVAGDRPGAARALVEGARRGAAAMPLVQVLCLAELSLIAIDDGDWSAAEAHVAHARAQTERLSLDDYPISAVVFAASAAVRAHSGLTDSCERDANRAARRLAATTGFMPWYMAQCQLALVHATLRLGDVVTTRQLLADADREVRGLPEGTAIEAELEIVRAECALASGGLDGQHEPLTSAELRVLQFLPTHLSFPEIAHQLYVSRNTVKTHVRAVYRKLTVSCRSEAVIRAREAGLLGPLP
jgi:LuxR family maltose regulon positive regulatory protein